MARRHRPAAAAGRLAASEERLRSTLDSMLDPHVVLKAVRDDAGTIVDFVFADANTAAAEFNGLSRDDLIGVPLLGQHPAAGTTTLFDDYVRVVETGEPIIRDDWCYPQDLMGGRNPPIRRAGGQVPRRPVADLARRDGPLRGGAADRRRGRAVPPPSRQLRRRRRAPARHPHRLGLTVGHRRARWRAAGVGRAELGGHSSIPTTWTPRRQPCPTPRDRHRPLPRPHPRTRRRLPLDRGPHRHVRRADGEPDGWIVSTRIVDAQVAAEQKLERLARFDTLTGVMNRAEAMTRLQAIIATDATRVGNWP